MFIRKFWFGDRILEDFYKKVFIFFVGNYSLQSRCISSYIPVQCEIFTATEQYHQFS